MSHFAVAVIHRNKGTAEGLLDRFSYDNMDNAERTVYLTREEYINDYRHFNPDSPFTDDEIWQTRVREYTDYDDNNIYTTINPDSFFDWCMLGGRYSTALKIKKGVDCERYFRDDESWDQTHNRYWRVSSARVQDILFDKMNNNKKKEKELRKLYQLNNCTKDIDEFLAERMLFYTYGIYDEDSDEWMNIDSFSSQIDYINHFYELIVERKDQWLSIIDCHS